MDKTPTNRGSSFLAQAAVLAFAGLFARLIGFLYKLPMYGMLGDGGMGIYNQGYSIYNFLLVLSSAGLPAAISRMVSARVALNQNGNAHKVFKVSLVYAAAIGLFASLALFFGAGIFCDMLAAPDALYSMRTLAPTVFIVAVMSSFRGYFQGMQNTVPTALSQVIEQIVNAVFSVFLVYLLYQESVPLAAAGGNAATGIGALAGFAVVLFIYARRKTQIHSDINKNSVYSEPETSSSIGRELIATAFPIIAGTAVFSAASLIDNSMVMERLMHNNAFPYEEALALYGQLSSKFAAITTLPVTIATSMGTASIPGISAAVARKDMKSLTSRINMSTHLAMVICVPAAFGIGIFADQILAAMFPSARGGGMLLKVGFISVVFLALNQISTGVLQGIGQVKIPAFAAFVGCAAKVIVNYVLLAIPSINVIGAVIGTIVCYAIAAPINLYFVYKFTGAKPDFSGIFIKPVICSALMSLVCFFLYRLVYFIKPRNSVSLLVSVAVGIVFYFAAMVLSGGLTKEDLSLLPMGKKLAHILVKTGFLKD